MDGLNAERKVVTPKGPIRRFALRLRPYWGWLVGAAVLLGLAVPIIASAYISTAPVGSRDWFWQEQLPQGNDLRSASWESTSTGWAVGVTGTVLKTVNGGGTWVAQDPGTTRDLTGVSFIGANNGWACGVSGTVIRTTNGGTTWVAQSAPTVPAARNFRSISFFNANVGVAVGDVGTTTSTINYTSDGGTTWRASSTTCTVGLTHVAMVSTSTGWAVGGAGAILKTIDGGASWTTQNSPTVAGLSAIDFAPGGTVGYLVGNATLPNWTAYKTVDGGATWAAVSGLGATGAINLTGVSCLDASNAMIVGTNGQVRHTTDGGVSWLNQSVNNLGQTALRDVTLIDVNTAKTIGDTGSTFFTRNSGRSWFTTMIGNTALLQAASFPDASHGWLAGANGTIMRTADAGATWETQASGITTWRGIHFSNATNGWVVGDGGQIRHTTDGVNWVDQVSPTTQQLNGVWFSSATNGIAVGNGGTVLMTVNAGTTWTLQPSTVTQNLNAIWSAGTTRAYAVGNGGVILRSNNGGASWTALSTPTAQTLLAVHGVSGQNVWVSGNIGTICVTNNNGNSWTNLTAGTGTTLPIRAIRFVSPTTGWFTSNFGMVKKTTDAGTTWTSQNAAVPTAVTDAVTGFWAMDFPVASTGYLAGDGGVIRRTTNAGTSWASLQYGTLLSLNGVSFPDSVNGWISGGSGTMMHTSDSGQTWSQQKTGSTSALNGLWMVDATSGWAVGDNGAVRRTTDGGQTWAAQTSNTTVNLGTVSAGSATNAILAGQGVVKYTTNSGSTWTSATVPPTQPISSVYMSSEATAFAVGTRAAGNNVVWRTTNGGNNWTSQTTTANANLWGVYFRTATEGYAVGDSGIILKTTDSGVNWIRKPTPTTLPLYGIRFTDASNGWAVGGGGVIVNTSDGGATWTLKSSGTARSLTSIGFMGAGQSWISGTNGTILRSSNLTPPSTTLAKSPSSPNGSNDWYITTPTVTLTSNRAGTTYYGWTSAAGPFSSFSGSPPASSFPAVAGDRTLFYYSVDTSGNAESVQTAAFKSDAIPPVPSSAGTATAVTTSTASIMWSAGADGVSGVERYEVSLNNGVTSIGSTTATSTVITGLTPNTAYLITIGTVDFAGNVSWSLTPIDVLTTSVATGPFNTVLSIEPTGGPNGSNGWYVTTPTVTFSTEPSSTNALIYYSWVSLIGPYSIRTVPSTTTPPAGASALFFSAQDVTSARSDEPTRQATFLVDTSVPDSPSVTASAASFSSVQLTWPDVMPPPSGIAQYEVYVDGGFRTAVTSPSVEVVGLSPSTTYSFVVYARSVAGTLSAGSTPQSAATLAGTPSAPAVVMAKSPTGDAVYLNWSQCTDAVGAVQYRLWRSGDGVSYSAVATTTGGVGDCAYIDRGLRSTTRYWYAVSTVDSRGESDLSSHTVGTWPYTAPITSVPNRVVGAAAMGLDHTVRLTWQAPVDPATIGYVIRRGSASLSTMTTITPYPALLVTDTTYFDLTAVNGETYYYQVASVNSSWAVGLPSVDVQARAVAPLPDNQPQPHLFGKESGCICHATHSSTTLRPLVRFPGANENTLCQTCHAPASSLSQFTDPLLKSKHPASATVTPSNPFSCVTCHRPLVRDGEPLDNLMRVDSSSPCVVVTDTPAGNGFCYSCHGTGSKLPMGDLTVFESSGHRTVPAPSTGANITCDTCHESHSSRNTQLLKYSGYMVCVQCHTSSASNPFQVDILSKLMLNEGANTKHPILPQDQVTGARMMCQNCHNTHTTTAGFPLVDPHNPSPSGTWSTPRSDEKAFCFRCHDGLALPTSAETTAWAPAVLGRPKTTGGSATTTTTDIQARYQVNKHGFGSASSPTTTTAHLRPDMGYSWGDVLECRACHDPHGSANNDAVLDTFVSADGSKRIFGVLTYKIPSDLGGGKDFRFMCATCHVWESGGRQTDPSSHDARAATDTVNFPMNCKACHGHSVGTPPGVNF